MIIIKRTERPALVPYWGGSLWFCAEQTRGVESKSLNTIMWNHCENVFSRSDGYIRRVAGNYTNTINILHAHEIRQAPREIQMLMLMQLNHCTAIPDTWANFIILELWRFGKRGGCFNTANMRAPGEVRTRDLGIAYTTQPVSFRYTLLNTVL